MRKVTYHRAQVFFSSLMNSNDSWWSYRSCRSKILLFRPIYFQGLYEIRIATIIPAKSTPIFLWQDSNDCAIFLDTACLFDLHKRKVTWEVVGDGSPFLSTVFLDEFDKIGIFIGSPGPLFTFNIFKLLTFKEAVLVAGIFIINIGVLTILLLDFLIFLSRHIWI